MGSQVGGVRICQEIPDLAVLSRRILGLRQIFIVKNFTHCSKIDKISALAPRIVMSRSGVGTDACRL